MNISKQINISNGDRGVNKYTSCFLYLKLVKILFLCHLRRCKIDEFNSVLVHSVEFNSVLVRSVETLFKYMNLIFNELNFTCYSPCREMKT